MGYFTRTELEEALAAANVAPLIQKQISPDLLEYQRRYAPLLAALPSTKWGSNVYYFNRRTARAAGGFVVDGNARAMTSSTFEQVNYTIRNLQTVGGVTGFAQAVTADLVGDLLQREIDGAVQSLYWDIENAVIWGNAGATGSGLGPEFDGLNYLASNYTAGSGSSNFVNAIDEAGAAFALRHMDLAIDLVQTNAAAPVTNNQWMFIVSPTIESKIAQLLTNQQRFMGQIEVAAGLIVPTYRNVPILCSSFLSARSNVMGTVTTATATTGGTLAAATYYYRVAPVIARFGLIQGSVEVSQTTTGSTSTVTLSFSTPTGPDSAGPLLYEVYRSTSTDTETLLGVVDAFDTTGVATTSIIDTGTNLLTNSSGNTGPAAYVNGNTGRVPRGATSSQGWEDFYLISRIEDNVVRPYVRELETLRLAPTTTTPDTLPFALVSDTTLALRAPKYVGRISNVSAAL